MPRALYNFFSSFLLKSLDLETLLICIKLRCPVITLTSVARQHTVITRVLPTAVRENVLENEFQDLMP